MAIPREPPADYAQLFRLERARLVETARSLTPDEWRRATPCPGWDVLGLVNHLVGDDFSVIAWQRDGHHGTPPPTGADEATFIEWLDNLQIEWVHAARRISPRLAIEVLEWLGPHVADTFAAQDTRSRSARVSWASDELVPVWLDQARELAERWIHRQQLREALDRPSDLEEDLAGPVLDALRWAYPYRLHAIDAPAASVAITIAGPFHRNWTLTNDADGWTFDDDHGAASASTVLSMTVEQAWRLLTNNYDTRAHRPLGTRGDPAVLEALLHTRAIIGVPKTR